MRLAQEFGRRKKKDMLSCGQNLALDDDDDGKLLHKGELSSGGIFT